MIRWECPNGKHPAVLGPERPRKDDVRRYCLPCSEDCGRLTERVSRKLQRKRAAAKAKAAARAKTQAKREAEKRARSFWGVEVTDSRIAQRGKWQHRGFGCKRGRALHWGGAKNSNEENDALGWRFFTGDLHELAAHLYRRSDDIVVPPHRRKAAAAALVKLLRAAVATRTELAQAWATAWYTVLKWPGTQPEDGWVAAKAFGMEWRWPFAYIRPAREAKK